MEELLNSTSSENIHSMYEVSFSTLPLPNILSSFPCSCSDPQEGEVKSSAAKMLEMDGASRLQSKLPIQLLSYNLCSLHGLKKHFRG